jgi:hypothetical protein
MMTESYITIAVRPDETLADVWATLARTMSEGGATEEQIVSMRTAFYIGAAQTYARIDGNTQNFRSFCDIMRDVHIEIDKVLGRSDFAVEGHA